MAERVISAKGNDEEGKFELSLRPKRLAEYIGQDKVKQNLRILIEAAKARAVLHLGAGQEVLAVLPVGHRP